MRKVLAFVALLSLGFCAFQIPMGSTWQGSAGGGPGGISATNLQVWYRGDSLTCTGGCTGTNVVTSLNDKSSNADNCTTSGSPTYVASAVNSQPGVLFGALYCTFGTALAWSGNVSVFVVWANTATGQKSSFLVGPSGSFKYWTCNTSEQGMDDSQVAQIGTGTTACDTSYHQMGGTYNSSAYAFYIASTTDGSGTQAESLSGSLTTLGATSGGEELHGTLVEFFVYSRILTGTEISTVQSYLHGRYGT